MQLERGEEESGAAILSCAGCVGKDEFERGEFSMCKAFEDMKEEGRQEGRIEGRAEEIVETGYEFGLTAEDILIRLQSKLNISLEEAELFLKMYEKQAV